MPELQTKFEQNSIYKFFPYAHNLIYYEILKFKNAIWPARSVEKILTLLVEACRRPLASRVPCARARALSTRGIEQEKMALIYSLKFDF